MVVLLLFALAGVAFVVAGQTGSLVLAGLVGWSTLWGVFLVLLAAFAGSCAAFSLVWARGLVDALGVREPGPAELFCALTAFLLGSVGSVPANLIVGWFLGENLTPGLAWSGVLGGFVLLPASSFLMRKALLLTDNVGVLSLAYLAPLFTLAWLGLAAGGAVAWSFALVGLFHAPAWLGVLQGALQVVRPDLLLIGAVGIVAANLLSNFETLRLYGVPGTVVLLWAVSAWLYLYA